MPTRPKKKLTQAERIALSDSKMLESATQLILEVGSAKTTLKDVGERAGYSRGLASSRFGSKEGLFLRLIDIHRHIWAEAITKHIGNKTGLAAIMARIDGVEELIRNEPEDIKAVYTLWFESVGRTSTMREQLTTFHEQTRQAVANFVRQGIDKGEIPAHVDPDLFAIDYFAQIFGFIYQWLFSPQHVDIFRCIETLRALCIFALTDQKAT